MAFVDDDGHVIASAEGIDTANLNPDGNYVIARFEAFGARWELSISPGCGVDLRNLETGLGGGGNCGGIGGSGGSDDPPNQFFYGPLNQGAVTAEAVTPDGRVYPAIAIGATPYGRADSSSVWRAPAREGVNPRCTRHRRQELSGGLDRLWAGHRWLTVVQPN